MSHELDVRVSDSERELVVSRLGDACVEGRLTVEELSERIDAAYAALTLRELNAIVGDLPVVTIRSLPRSRSRRPYFPGIRSFRERFVATAPRDRILDSVLVAVAPRLEARGYETVTQDERTVVFERDWRPTWTIAAAILVFPVGLVALLHKQRSRVLLSVVENERGLEVTASGTAPLFIRRAFVELRD